MMKNEMTARAIWAADLAKGAEEMIAPTEDCRFRLETVGCAAPSANDDAPGCPEPLSDTDPSL